MASDYSRRAFLTTLGAVAAASSGSLAAGRSVIAASIRSAANATPSAFKVSVLTDEISQDLGHALEVATQEFGLGWVELRELWNKNITRLDDKEIAEAKRLIEGRQLRVSAIASPVFKVDWPGAPRSPFGSKDDSYKADFVFAQQDEVLERSFELARRLGTDHIRIFDFWRLDDPAPYRAAMDDKLRQAADKAAKLGLVLVLENEYACNTATSAESIRTLDAVRSRAFKLNWDPGNAGMRGDAAFPDGYARLPKDRIGHVHCKNVSRKAGGGFEWSEMGTGLIDWTAQFRALLKDGYHGPVTLETHWRGAGTPEASTRVAWTSMKRQLQEARAF
ncbi:MAG TPA: sugar phosphate isomerase/epimerase family protein [Vicinamibacterales bacterium]|jgi:sugar phosphate isomerase/epimerase